MLVLGALALVAAIVAPHLLPLNRATPGLATATWLLALVLRGLTAVGAVTFLVVSLPQSALFAAVARWCLHRVTPLLTNQLALSGHALADGAVVLPVLALAGSLMWLLFGAVRAALAMRSYLQQRTRGAGPHGSTVVADSAVLVALTGFGRPRVLISEAALGILDPDELAASVAHERGHVRRWHRPLLFTGGVLRALGRLLPGTAAAQRGLMLSLEREADEYAVAQTRNPLALASAICKAAAGHHSALSPALGGNGAVRVRLECLLDGRRARGGGVFERRVRLLASMLAVLTLVLAPSASAWAVADQPAPSPQHAALICRH